MTLCEVLRVDMRAKFGWFKLVRRYDFLLTKISLLNRLGGDRCGGISARAYMLFILPS